MVDRNFQNYRILRINIFMILPEPEKLNSPFDEKNKIPHGFIDYQHFNLEKFPKNSPFHPIFYADLPAW